MNLIEFMLNRSSYNNEDNIAIFSHIINHKMYKLNKNNLYYKSDLITTSVQRLNSTLRPISNLYPTLIQRHVFAGMHL